MALTASEMKELVKIVKNGTIEQLQTSIKEPDQELMNALLVRALISGREDMFFHLLKENPKADISCLSNDRINTYLDPVDFNIAHPPFSEAESDSRLRGVGKILRYIKTAGYSNINLPSMAAYFGDASIMDSLIKDGKGKWDFSRSIGHRETTPVSLAINDGSERCKKVAFQIIDASDRIGLDISSQRTGIASLCAMGKVEEAQEYISRIGEKPLSFQDIQEIMISLPAAFHNCNDDPEKIAQLNKIADKIGEDISRHYKTQISGVLSNLERHWEVVSDQSISHIQLDTEDRTAAFQRLLIKAIPSSDIHKDRIHNLVDNISQLSNHLDSGINSAEPTSPVTPTSHSKPGFLKRIGSRVGRVVTSIENSVKTSSKTKSPTSISRKFSFSEIVVEANKSRNNPRSPSGK